MRPRPGPSQQEACGGERDGPGTAQLTSALTERAAQPTRSPPPAAVGKLLNAIAAGGDWRGGGGRPSPPAASKVPARLGSAFSPIFGAGSARTESGARLSDRTGAGAA